MRRILAVAAALAVAVVATSGVASAAPSGKLDVQVIGNVRIDASDPTVGYVTARYICEGGDGAHVWVSAKQSADAAPESWLAEEGSGASSATWSHSHANTVTCDGTWRVGTFTINQDEWGWGTLRAGQAWVQFCVIPPGEDPENGGAIAWSMRFAAVK